jgi:hypothetical protein
MEQHVSRDCSSTEANILPKLQALRESQGSDKRSTSDRPERTELTMKLLYVFLVVAVFFAFGIGMSVVSYLVELSSGAFTQTTTVLPWSLSVQELWSDFTAGIWPNEIVNTTEIPEVVVEEWLERIMLGKPETDVLGPETEILPSLGSLPGEQMVDLATPEIAETSIEAPQVELEEEPSDSSQVELEEEPCDSENPEQNSNQVALTIFESILAMPSFLVKLVYSFLDFLGVLNGTAH